MMGSKSSPPSFLINLFLIFNMWCAMMVQQGLAISINEEKNVSILNMIIPRKNNPIQPPKELLVHCKSKDDDLGEWKLPQFGSNSFGFRVNFWKTTLYWCRFVSGSKSASVVVFDAKDHRCDGEFYCHWEVRPDGFYFAKGMDPLNSDFVRLASWTN